MLQKRKGTEPLGLQSDNIPRHVAVIMDGNGRWATERGQPRSFGHRRGANTLESILQLASNVGIEILTIYAFSEENWQRPQVEVRSLFSLLESYLRLKIEKLKKNNVSLRVMGDLHKIPRGAKKILEDSIDYLKDNDGIILNVALSYGGRQEIVEACRSMAQEVSAGSLRAEDITMGSLEKKLFTRGLGDPDLLIRTGNEYRISNFLLWQIAYTELYFSPICWPSFRDKDFLDALKDYQMRKRRYGKVS